MICSECGASVEEEEVAYEQGTSYCAACMNRLIEMRKKFNRTNDLIIQWTFMAFACGAALFVIFVLIALIGTAIGAHR